MNKKEALIEYITQDIIGYIMIDCNIDMGNAMHIFYNSKFYDILFNTETGLYLEGSAYSYEFLKEELNL